MISIRTLFALVTVPLLSAVHANLSVTIQVMNETCDHHNGILTASASGGLEPYQYQWSNGATTESITGLDEGQYTVDVIDALGATATSSWQLFDVPYLETQYLGWTSLGGLPCPDQCNGHFSVPLEGLNGIQPYSLGLDAGFVEIPDYPHPQFGGICDEVPVTLTVTDAMGCSGSMVVTVDGPEGYPIEVHDINPSCEGQGNGNAIMVLPAEEAFDIGYHVIVTNTWTLENVFARTVWGEVGAGEVPLQDLSTGTYQIHQIFYTDGEPCTRDYLFDVGSLPGDCGTVQGDVWYDADGDCVLDGTEVVIPYNVLAIDPIGAFAITNSDGHYSYNLEDAPAYYIGPVDPSLTPLCQPALPIPFTIASNTVTIDMADWSDEPLDLVVQANASVARPGFDQDIWLDVVNVSPQACGPVTLICELSPELEFTSAAPPPNSVNGNTLTWQLGGLGSFGGHHVLVLAHLPASVFLGTAITTTVSGSTSSGEVDLSNNQAVSSVTAIGAYDPNFKEGFTSTRQSATEYIIGEDEWIDYSIHFQNTGTAAATTVVIKDTIPEELDLSSYEQGLASHTFNVAFKPGRVVEWSFLNIQLPDSGSDQAASHGVVSFRIRPVQPVLPGTEYRNRAHIYFDFNEPVITEHSVLVAELSTRVHGISQSARSGLSLYPNPAKEHVIVSLADQGIIAEVGLYSIDGRPVRQQRPVPGRVELDLRGLAAGTYLVAVRTNGGNWLQGHFAIE